jgi:16S rRNA processing protein RimM
MKPHGLKGQVTLSLSPDAPADFDDIETLFIEVRERLLPYFIERISIKGGKAYLKLEDVDTPEDAQGLSRASVYLPRELRPASEQGYHDDELIGFEVMEQDLGLIGQVSDVVQAGPNRLLSITHDGREVLIPIQGPFITDVSTADKRIAVTLPEGFLDL